MSIGIDSIGSVQQVTPKTVVPLQTATTPSASSFTVADSSASDAPLQNQRVIQDPTAGFITQYLSSNDSQVIAQTPSAITVAYLRLGLTAEGLTKESQSLTHISATA